MIHLGKTGSDRNCGGISHCDSHNTLLGGYENIMIEKNGNNPPTVKRYSRFSVWATEDNYTLPIDEDTLNLSYPQNTTPTYLNSEAIYEPDEDVTFTWGGTTRGETLSAISDGIWYIYCLGGYDLDATTKGWGKYGVSKAVITYHNNKAAWHTELGVRRICRFTVASSIVTNIEILHSVQNVKYISLHIADYTAIANDSIIIMNGSNLTLTLPKASTVNGVVYYVKNLNATNLTINGNASETIDGALTVTVAQYECYCIVCNGLAWYII